MPCRTRPRPRRARGRRLALHRFERAAKPGLAETQFCPGNMHAYSMAQVPENHDPQRVAAPRYLVAAGQGHADAKAYLRGAPG
jgi:hypothetical protein